MSKVKKEKSKKGKIIRRVIIGIAVGAVVIIYALSRLGAQNPMQVVNVQTPLTEDLEEVLTTSGIVNSAMSKIYYSNVSATVDTVNFREGASVNKGDMILTYDAESLQDELTKTELNYRSSNITYTAGLSDGRENQSDYSEATNNLAVLKQQIADLESYAESLQKSYDDMLDGDTSGLTGEAAALQSKLTELNAAATGATGDEAISIAAQIAQIQKAITANTIAQKSVGKGEKYDDLKKLIEETNDKIAACKEYQAEMQTQKSKSEAGLLDNNDREKLNISEQLSQNAYEDSKDALTKAMDGIKADFNGVISQVSIKDGMIVQQGLSMFLLESDEKVEVEIGLVKYDLAKVSIGQKAIITINDKEYNGTVQSISRKATMNSQGSTILNAIISIDNPDEDIYLGVEAGVKIITASKSGALCIPVEALNADKEGEFVYLAVNNIVEKRYVTSGISSTSYIEILEGITAEDKVITNVSTAVTEGIPVMTVEN